MTATGGEFGPGIGQGGLSADSSSSTITISGGTITATGVAGGAGIGGGSMSTTLDVTISGCAASIEATGGADVDHGGGAGVGNGGHTTATSALPLTIAGVASGTPATAGGAGHAGDTGAGGVASPITVTGTPSTWLVTTASTNGQAAGDGGSFSYSCVDPASSSTASPDLASTGVNATGGLAVVVGLLVLGVALALVELARRRRASRN